MSPVFSLIYSLDERSDSIASVKNRWAESAAAPTNIEHIIATKSDFADTASSLYGFRHFLAQNSNTCGAIPVNTAARLSSGQILINLSNDNVPIRHWDEKIAARFRDLSRPGVLRVSDGKRADDMISIAIFTRAYLNMLGGEFLCTEYQDSFSLEEFIFRAYQDGVVIDARDIVLECCPASVSAGAVYDERSRRQNENANCHKSKRIFLRRNPSARGHWLHEGTEERFYLPPGHSLVQNFIGPVHLSPSPLSRNVSLQGATSKHASLQLGYRGARGSGHGAIRKLGARLKSLLCRTQAAGKPENMFQSTLWSGEGNTVLRKTVSRASHEPIPIFIISYNQPTYLRNMVTQLLRLDVTAADIHILDNASSHPAVMEYLHEAESNGIKVTRLERNFGPHEIFAPEAGVGWPDVFALTDPDLQFNPRMPVTFRQDLYKIATACGVWKCGLALSLDDAELFKPGPYVCGHTIAEWEKRFWSVQVKVDESETNLLKRAGAQVYKAEVDTTFAVYLRDHPRTSFLQAVRVSGLYCARHLPWYSNQHDVVSGHDSTAGEIIMPDSKESSYYYNTSLHHATLSSSQVASEIPKKEK